MYIRKRMLLGLICIQNRLGHWYKVISPQISEPSTEHPSKHIKSHEDQLPSHIQFPTETNFQHSEILLLGLRSLRLYHHGSLYEGQLWGSGKWGEGGSQNKTRRKARCEGKMWKGSQKFTMREDPSIFSQWVGSNRRRRWYGGMRVLWRGCCLWRYHHWSFNPLNTKTPGTQALAAKSPGSQKNCHQSVSKHTKL